MSFIRNNQDFEPIVFKKNTKKTADVTKRNIDSDSFQTKKIENDNENLRHDRTTCSNEIKMYRNSNGLTQEQLAKMMNMSKKVVQEYEQGKAIPTNYEMQKFRRVFNCSIKK